MAVKPKLLQILSMYHEAGEAILAEGADVVRTDRYDEDHLCEIARDVEAIVLRAPARITRAVIDAAPSLRVISGAGVGLDNIDVRYATEKSIPVLHAPSVNAVSTAEHAVAIIMALGKSLIPFHRQMSRGRYASRTELKTYELSGKRVGLIGFGNIAKEVAKRVKLGLNMNVSVWVRQFDPVKHAEAEEWGFDITTNMDRVFAESDFVSLHTPLTDATKGMIDRRLLDLMKPSAFLVNTARGGIVNQADLFRALTDGSIAGAGLDVFEPEPPAADSPLLSLPNVIVTPHVGGTTVETNYTTATTVARNVLRALAGERPEHVGNPSVYGKSV
ncbi:hydroxyacid dehydrogenase [Paenibacillus mesophilus]|uniref:hydroxyacid dehydrogenase n=1 Tax=Paenibacillus mesophilus TaxID=2582849 RepID=UPI001EE3DF17|nr:hydroxyacid dehydrogenase [Paenibacillus mesophilus]